MRFGRGFGWQGGARVAGFVTLAIAAQSMAAQAWAQPADPDAPLPTARYERPPEGVNPAILTPPPTPPPEPAAPAASAPPAITLPDVPAVRRRGGRTPESLETPTAAPQERPWERPPVEARVAPVPEPKAVRPAPAGRMVELQIGAFADRGNAERAARAAQMAGPTRLQTVKVNGVTYYRVIVGPAREAALKSSLTKLGFPDARPVRP